MVRVKDPLKSPEKRVRFQVLMSALSNCIIFGYDVLVQGGQDVFHLVVGLVRSLDAEHPVVHVQYLNLQ